MKTDSTGNLSGSLRLVRRNLLLLAAIALAVFACAPSCRADSAARLEKHARKMQKHLARYHAGTLLQIDLRNNSEALGSLGDLSSASFQIVSIDSNRTLTFSYADVACVKKGKEYIGAGSEPGHHVRHWVPILVGAVAAGGGIAAYEAFR
ncbi:MAG: hypothetical protein WBP85_04815 [Terracidiphilus sp.]